ncbi:MAG: DUF4859 domain-containing protein [Tannerellaceae bacterium]|nr:DUF4859 domain-containing protein [Tannerellaceae bacterium]
MINIQLLNKLKTSRLYSFLSIFFCWFLFTATSFTFISCDDEETEVEITDPKEDEEEKEVDLSEIDKEKVYIPYEFRNMDFDDESSQFYWGRSKQSEHFVVFWEPGFGLDPNASSVEEFYRVDIDDLLEKAEMFFDLNINTLKFAELGTGKSRLDEYKMMIMLYYTTEWMAYGSGYDDVIGALWINPATCKPVGSTIAHEIGHSFQYQVYCDLGGTSGFRYGYGDTNGNAFWEQTAQWQSYQPELYLEEAFTTYNFTVYTTNYFRHIISPWQRYASYFIHYYWTQLHGRDMVAKVWQQAVSPEDPLETYMRINGLTLDQFNDELYDMAARLTTWDLDEIRTVGANYIGAHSYKLNKVDDNKIYQVAWDHCPNATGYNVIPLNVPAAGTEITVDFKGIVGDPSYNTTDASLAGWRYGFVALLESGDRVYGDMNRADVNYTTYTASFEVPANCRRLWLVISTATTEYIVQPWNEKDSETSNTDPQFPYQIQITNTDLYGNIELGDGTPEDVSILYNVAFPASSDYLSASVTIEGENLVKLAQAFVLQPNEINSKFGEEIKFAAVEPDGNLNYNYTANGYGHWFDAEGYVTTWGTDSYVYTEYNSSSMTFEIGQFPDKCSPGDTYTFKEAFVYTYESDKTAVVTFTFNITIQ